MESCRNTQAEIDRDIEESQPCYVCKMEDCICEESDDE